MIVSKPRLIMQLFMAANVAAWNTNLTTYLLTKYADYYHNVTTQPAFFHQVLNGTVEPERVAYFFEQVCNNKHFHDSLAK